MHHRRDPLQPQAPHYDIREIDEALYLAVLACHRAETAGVAVDLANTAPDARGTAKDAAGH
jgi:hypothetical protein